MAITRYGFSTLRPDDHIETLNTELRQYCAKRGGVNTDEDRQKLMSLLLRRAGTAAFQGASRLEGGPFGALIVDFKTADGVPVVVGYGTNHVVPNNDPSAHAEMTAIRDASQRLGKTDLSGLTLVTSCECCPMCLSAATGCKVDKIYFAATRDDAAAVGFSDADQYRLGRAGGIELHAQKAASDEALAGHDAAVTIRHNGTAHTYYGDYASANPNDPTDIPCVQAVKKACAGLSELTGERVFHLPEDTQLISRDQPHPLSLIAADWARIGRVRGANPTEPLQDAPDKDTTRIQYVNDKVEHMALRNQGQSSEVDPAAIWQEIASPSAVHLQQDLGVSHQVAFREWDRLVQTGFMPRY